MENVNTDEQVQLENLYHPQNTFVLKKFMDGKDVYYRMSTAQMESRLSGYSYNERILTELQRQVGQLQEYLQENHEDIDDNILYDLTQIFDLNLEKTLQVTASVDVSFTVTVPLHEADDFEFSDNDFDISISSYRYSIDNEHADVMHWEAEEA